MNDSLTDEQREILLMTSDIVAAYVGSNAALSPDELPDFIGKVHGALSTAAGLKQAITEETRELVPAVPIRASVKPDYIICLEDGKRFKMLKRHLRTSYGMSPDEYRARWGLPATYPMTAPNYSERRRGLAKDIGLGKGGRGGQAGLRKK